MKKICRKSGEPCAQCMKGLIPDVEKCPHLIRLAEDEKEEAALAREGPDSSL